MSGSDEEGQDQPENLEKTSRRVNKKRKTTREKSRVRDHFDKVTEVIDNITVLKAKCRYCHHSLSRGGTHGTTLLKHHADRCRPDLQLKSPRSEPVFDQEFSRKVLSWCCIKHKYPFSIGDHQYFHLLLKSLNPNFNVPCRNTIRSNCIQNFEDEKVKAYDYMGKLDCRVTLTTDIWTAENNGTPFIVLTAHFIDDSWILHKKVLAFREFLPPHDGDSLFRIMKDLILEWNLDKKLYSVVVDNASNNDVMIRLLKDWLGGNFLMNGELFHIRCSAHILNLVVQDGLHEVKGLIEKIRESVTYLKKSTVGRHEFENAKNLLGLDHLKEVASDVPNRWNFTFDLLDTALPLKEAFARLAIIDKKYNHNPEPEEWSNMRNYIIVYIRSTYQLVTLVEQNFQLVMCSFPKFLQFL